MTAWFYYAGGKFARTLDLPDDFVRSGVNARLPKNMPFTSSWPPDDKFDEPEHHDFRQVSLGEHHAIYEEIM